MKGAKYFYKLLLIVGLSAVSMLKYPLSLEDARELQAERKRQLAELQKNSQ